MPKSPKTKTIIRQRRRCRAQIRPVRPRAVVVNLAEELHTNEGVQEHDEDEEEHDRSRGAQAHDETGRDAAELRPRPDETQDTKQSQGPDETLGSTHGDVDAARDDDEIETVPEFVLLGYFVITVVRLCTRGTAEILQLPVLHARSGLAIVMRQEEYRVI